MPNDGTARPACIELANERAIGIEQNMTLLLLWTGGLGQSAAPLFACADVCADIYNNPSSYIMGGGKSVSQSLHASIPGMIGR